MAHILDILTETKVAEGTPEFERLKREIDRPIPPIKPMRPHPRIRDIQDIPLPPKKGK